LLRICEEGKEKYIYIYIYFQIIYHVAFLIHNVLPL